MKNMLKYRFSQNRRTGMKQKQLTKQDYVEFFMGCLHQKTVSERVKNDLLQMKRQQIASKFKCKDELELSLSEKRKAEDWFFFLDKAIKYLDEGIRQQEVFMEEMKKQQLIF